MSILEIAQIIRNAFTLHGNLDMEEKEWPGEPPEAISTKSFEEIKDALRKTLHAMIDLDFDDGKLDGAINCFLLAKKFQISLTFNLNPNDVILIRNLTKNKVTEEVLENIRRARNGQS